MTISSSALTRAWIGVLIYLVILSLVGAVTIPAGDIATRWSWGDWTPVDRTSKPLGLSLVPVFAALVAGTSIGRRRAADLEFITAPFTWVEILAMVVVVVAHTVIVFAAI